jgi:hypothetical protein
MYHESTRDMKDRERRLLQDSLAFTSPVSTRRMFIYMAAWICALLLLGVGEVILFSVELHPALRGLLGVVLVLAGIASLFGFMACVSGYFRWRRYVRHFHRDTAPMIRAALESGKVLSKQVTADSVIVFKEFDDEGPACIFGIGDGRSLILKGQQCLPVDINMPWPSSKFEIARSADTGMWIGIFSSGEPLTPIRIVKMADCNDDFFWADMEEVVQGSPDEVLAEVLKHPEKQSPRQTGPEPNPEP